MTLVVAGRAGHVETALSDMTLGTPAIRQDANGNLMKNTNTSAQAARNEPQGPMTHILGSQANAAMPTLAYVASSDRGKAEYTNQELQQPLRREPGFEIHHE